MVGLTSITFRSMTVDEIICLAVEAGLQGIEWGSDVHVPPGDIALAKETARKTKEAGLTVTSYGSYLRVTGQPVGEKEIEDLIRSAKALGAPVIRIWAGPASPQDVLPEERIRIEDILKHLVRKAAGEHILIATEYHRRTLTENAGSALDLLARVPGLYTYWQPNPDISHAENLKELTAVLPYVLNVHVFQWTAPGNERHPLIEGEKVWKEYIGTVLQEKTRPHHFLLEFAAGDSPRQCVEDAAVLKEWIR